MTRGVPMLDPKVHLKGATPEKLARALLRRVEPLRPARGKNTKAAGVQASASKPSSKPAKPARC